MTPTKEEIELAEALQKRGLCQGAKESIFYFGDETRIYKIIPTSEAASLEKLDSSLDGMNDGSSSSGWKKIGPLPKASESWPELRAKLQAKGQSIELSSHILTHDYADKEEIRHVCSLNDDNLDNAMAQALLEDEGEG